MTNTPLSFKITLKFVFAFFNELLLRIAHRSAPGFRQFVEFEARRANSRSVNTSIALSDSVAF
jgi:hypothetical protein